MAQSNTSKARLKAAALPASNHVVLVVEENHSYESVIGSSAMPFLNSLASQYGLATQYFANAHDSIPNYFWLTAGTPVTSQDNTRSFFNVDNITRYLLSGGKTWKAYAESLPYAGYVGYNVSPYVKRHNPLAYFTDVAFSSEKYNIVPFSQFGADLRNGTLPNFSFVSPNLLHDAHDGSLATADQWLRKNIGPLLASPAFQPGGNGILIITFDESTDHDCRPTRNCELGSPEYGGHVATVIVGPAVRHGYKSSTFYRHENLLKTIADALRLPGAPGSAASARSMRDFF